MINFQDLPASISPIFSELWHQVAGLNIKWQTYRKLFLNSLLEEAAIKNDVKKLYTIIERSISDDVIMAIGRILDPKTSMGKLNLSLDQLVCCLPDESLNIELSKKHDEIKQQEDRIRTWRNKRVSHFALKSADSCRGRLPDLPMSDIEDVIRDINDFMNEIANYYNCDSTKFNELLWTKAADSFLNIIDLEATKKD